MNKNVFVAFHTQTKYGDHTVTGIGNINMVVDRPIEGLASVMPEKRAGHWIYIRNSEVNGLKIVKCSECGKRTYGSGKYCQNCGAKMGSEVQE